jgi:hypothetical protein
MRRGPTGETPILPAVGGEQVRPFVPCPLPPRPPLAPDPGLRDALDRALVALGRLDSVATLLPDALHLFCTYIRKMSGAGRR